MKNGCVVMPDEKNEVSERAVLLAWDTCTEAGIIAVGRSGVLEAETRFETARGGAHQLMPFVDSTLDELGIIPEDIGALAVGLGPGGFTGVKVSVATGKALARALDVPLVGIPTLDLLAAHAPEGDGPVIACMDARRGFVYATGYTRGGSLLKRATGYTCVSPEETGHIAAGLGHGRVTAVGYVPDSIVSAASSAGVEVEALADADVGFPMGRALLARAFAMIESGLCGNAFSIVPIYLKKEL